MYRHRNTDRKPCLKFLFMKQYVTGLQHVDTYARRFKNIKPSPERYFLTLTGLTINQVWKTKNGVKHKKNSKTNANSILMTRFLAALLFSPFVCRIPPRRFIRHDFPFCLKVSHDFNFFVEKIGVPFDDEVSSIRRKDEVSSSICFRVPFLASEIKTRNI